MLSHIKKAQAAQDVENHSGTQSDPTPKNAENLTEVKIWSDTLPSDDTTIDESRIDIAGECLDLWEFYRQHFNEALQSDPVALFECDDDKDGKWTLVQGGDAFYLVEWCSNPFYGTIEVILNPHTLEKIKHVMDCGDQKHSRSKALKERKIEVRLYSCATGRILGEQYGTSRVTPCNKCWVCFKDRVLLKTCQQLKYKTITKDQAFTLKVGRSEEERKMALKKKKEDQKKALEKKTEEEKKKGENKEGKKEQMEKLIKALSSMDVCDEDSARKDKELSMSLYLGTKTISLVNPKKEGDAKKDDDAEKVVDTKETSEN